MEQTNFQYLTVFILVEQTNFQYLTVFIPLNYLILERPLQFNIPDNKNISNLENVPSISIHGYQKGNISRAKID